MIYSFKKLVTEKENRGAMLIAGIYLLTSALWVLLSDRLAARLTTDPAMLTRISIIKGWGFVLVTTLLLFLLIRSYVRSIRAGQVYLQLISDALPAALAYIDADRRYRFNNRAYEEWVGRSREEIFGLQPAEVLGKTTYERLQSYMDAALAGQGSTFETFIPRANGQQIQTEITYIPDVRQDGLINGFVVVAVNIDERKRNEEALRHSEERYRLLAKNIADVVWVMDAASLRFTYVSPSVERLRGYTAEEVTAQSLKEVMTPDSLAMINSVLPPRLSAFILGDQQVQTQTYEIEQYRKDGSVVWTEVVTTLVNNPTGDLEILGVTRDITERKRAESVLREREALYRGVIETSSDGFCITDLQGHILEVNQAYIQQSGYSRDELLRMRIHDLNAHEPPEKPLDQTASAIRNGSHIYETHQIRKDGTVWQVEVNISYWPIHGGRLFAFLRDIRQRKRSEALLRTRLNLSEMGLHTGVNELLQYTLDQAELFTGSHVGFFHRVEDDQKNLSLQLWSKRTLKDYCHVDRPKMHYPVDEAGIWTDCLITGAPVLHNDYASLAHKKGLPEGHAPLTRLLTVPILRNGRAAAIMGVGNKSSDYTQEDIDMVQELTSIMMDVVARKQAEEAAARYAAELEQRVAERTADLRRANAELEQASRGKDEFLASISHELRTPLNAILTLAESLEEGTYDPLSDRQRKPLHTIAESGYHLLNLINDLLDLSKIEAGKLGLQIAVVEVEPLCQASLRLVRQQAQNKNLYVSFQIDPSVKSVQTDPRRFKQMLVNLLGNAVKFTPPGGQIGLDVRGDRAAGALRLTVWDTGIGVSIEDARRLFQPFVQVDSGLTRQFGGTGLGLSLVYRMAELHGGGISMESTPAGGSRFTISLPWGGTAGDPLGTRPLRPIQAPEIHRALVVTATASLAEQLGRYLSELGAQMIHAANGPAALALATKALATKEPLDVILLDLQLPGESGPETLARLTQDERSRSTPVIVLSEFDEVAARKTAEAAGDLMKPVTRQRLVEALWKAMNKSAEQVAVSGLQPLILIADDHPANRTIYADHLTAKGYRVLVTSNGAETIERAREALPSLILIDVQLPEIDGVEVTQRLRADPRSAALPIIAITALAIAGDRERCLAAGVSEYLTKPVSLKILTQKIETLLEGRNV